MVFNPSNIVELETACKLNHEVELGVVIGEKGKNVSLEQAQQMIGGYFLGIDFTCSSVAQYRENKMPFCIPKIKDNYLVVSEWVQKDKVSEVADLDLELSVNGLIIQKGNTNNMVFSVAQAIQYISTHMTLNQGDFIITGTPHNISTVQHQDQIYAKLSQKNHLLAQLSFTVHLNTIQEDPAFY